jgi:hypothetical protein
VLGEGGDDEDEEDVEGRADVNLQALREMLRPDRGQLLIGEGGASASTALPNGPVGFRQLHSLDQFRAMQVPVGPGDAAGRSNVHDEAPPEKPDEDALLMQIMLKALAAESAAAGGASSEKVMLLMMMRQMMSGKKKRRDEAAADSDGSSSSPDRPKQGLALSFARMRRRRKKFRTRLGQKEIRRRFKELTVENLNPSGSQRWDYLELFPEATAFQKHKSLGRAGFILLQIIQAADEEESVDRCAAIAIQGWKALLQFAIDGDWRNAWALSLQRDPYGSARWAGDEMELADVAGLAEAEDRLAKKLAARAEETPAGGRNKGKKEKQDGA